VLIVRSRPFDFSYVAAKFAKYITKCCIVLDVLVACILLVTYMRHQPVSILQPTCKTLPILILILMSHNLKSQNVGYVPRHLWSTGHCCPGSRCLRMSFFSCGHVVQCHPFSQKYTRVESRHYLSAYSEH
jgi:hypothetical protein